MTMWRAPDNRLFNGGRIVERERDSSRLSGKCVLCFWKWCDGFREEEEEEEDEDPRLCFEVLGEAAMSLRPPNGSRTTGSSSTDWRCLGDQPPALVVVEIRYQVALPPARKRPGRKTKLLLKDNGIEGIRGGARWRCGIWRIRRKIGLECWKASAPKPTAICRRTRPTGQPPDPLWSAAVRAASVTSTVNGVSWFQSPLQPPRPFFVPSCPSLSLSLSLLFNTESNFDPLCVIVRRISKDPSALPSYTTRCTGWTWSSSLVDFPPFLFWFIYLFDLFISPLFRPLWVRPFPLDVHQIPSYVSPSVRVCGGVQLGVRVWYGKRWFLVDATDTLHIVFICLFFFFFSFANGKWRHTGSRQQEQEPSDWKSLNNADTGQLLSSCKKGTLLPPDWTTTSSCHRSEQHSFGGVVASCVGDKPLAVRGRSASEPSFLSASRAVKVRVSSPVPSSNSRSSYTPPAVKGEIDAHKCQFSLSLSFIYKWVLKTTWAQCGPSLVFLRWNRNGNQNEFLLHFQEMAWKRGEYLMKRGGKEKEKQVFLVSLCKRWMRWESSREREKARQRPLYGSVISRTICLSCMNLWSMF